MLPNMRTVVVTAAGIWVAGMVVPGLTANLGLTGLAKQAVDALAAALVVVVTVKALSRAI